MNKEELADLEKQYSVTPDVRESLKLDEKYRAHLEEQVAKDPQNIHALIHLGILCWEPFHQEDKAIEYLEKAINLDPQNTEARFWLAKCIYHDFCDYDRAKRLLLEALQLAPEKADCLSLLAAIICDTTENWNEAIGYLEKAIQSAPDWLFLHYDLGILYLKVGKISLAEQAAQKMKELVHFPPKKPRNFVEDYHERVVTGRGSKTLSEELAQLKDEIQKAKTLNEQK